MTVCLSHGGDTTFSPALPANRILVGTIDGIAVVDRDDAGAWNATGTWLRGSHINSLIVERTSGALFAGIDKGGIQTSTDGGATWVQCNRGLTQLNIYSMCASHDGQAVRVYAGTEPAHLFVSNNLGADWAELSDLQSIESSAEWTFPGPPFVAHVKNLACDPVNPSRMYACVEQGCLLKSEDAGQTWTELYGVDEDAHRIVVHPMHPEILYLTTGNGLYRSENHGTRWKHITPRTLRIGYPDPLLIHPTREGLMFMSGALHGPEVWRTTKTANSAIGRSVDGGRTWEFLRDGLPDFIHGNLGAMSMEANDGGFNLFAGGTDGEVYYSGDGGDHWTTIVSGLAPLSKGKHYAGLKRPIPAAV